ncbi:SgcJ/EcaC family oxidoreductase [Virgibacillus ainsalahensis]
MENTATNDIQKLYHNLIYAWNKRNARAMSDVFTENGEQIGFDGSQILGRDEIFSHLEPIFKDHPTPPFVTKVKEVYFLSSDAAVLRAIAGMVPPDQTDINPDLNTHHTLIAVNHEGKWLVRLFQNTPAQFHGRPELVEEMTNELRESL